MRNFCVAPGTRVVTPEVTRVRDGKVMRPSRVLVAGYTATKSPQFRAIMRVINANIIAAFVSYFICRWSAEMVFLILSMAILICLGLINFMYDIGRRGLDKHTRFFCKHENIFALADISSASKSSQPSKYHRYFIMRFDFTKHEHDLIVTSKIKADDQKYWSLTVYDEFGIPLPQFVNVENILHFPGHTPCSLSSDKISLYTASIRLTTEPCNSGPSIDPISFITPEESEPLPKGSTKNTQPKSHRSTTAHATIDVSGCRKGFAIFRIVHPKDEEVIRYSAPVVGLAHRHANPSLSPVTKGDGK